MMTLAASILSRVTCDTLPKPPSDSSRSSKSPYHLLGRRVLVVEDDYTLAMDLEETLLAAGAVVLGPVPDLDGAFEAVNAEAVDGAILDVRLRGETVYPLADLLRDLGVKFLLVTGIDTDDLPRRHAQTPLCPKPLDMNTAVAALSRLMAAR